MSSVLQILRETPSCIHSWAAREHSCQTALDDPFLLSAQRHTSGMEGSGGSCRAGPGGGRAAGPGTGGGRRCAGTRPEAAGCQVCPCPRPCSALDTMQGVDTKQGIWEGTGPAWHTAPPHRHRSPDTAHCNRTVCGGLAAPQPASGRCRPASTAPHPPTRHACSGRCCSLPASQSGCSHKPACQPVRVLSQLGP